MMVCWERMPGLFLREVGIMPDLFMNLNVISHLPLNALPGPPSPATTSGCWTMSVMSCFVLYTRQPSADRTTNPALHP